MPTIDEIRRANLHTLITEFGGNKAFADRLGVAESQLSQWAKGAINSGTGKPRGMRTETAQRIENAAGRPPGWLDQDHSASGPAATTVVEIRPTISLDAALAVLGRSLEAEMPQDVREDVAHALSNLARRQGALRDQQMVVHLLSGLKAEAEPSKRVA